VAYGLYFSGLPRATAATAGVTTLLEPLTATVLAVALLGDRPTWVTWAGAGLLLISVLDAVRHGPSEPRRLVCVGLDDDQEVS
jgi:DME family drug/metabolite transporter